MKFVSSPSIAKLITVPPIPPPPYTMPFANPRFLLKYWAGIVEATFNLCYLPILGEKFWSMHTINCKL
jgi:hypothetical protein